LIRGIIYLWRYTTHEDLEDRYTAHGDLEDVELRFPSHTGINEAERNALTKPAPAYFGIREGIITLVEGALSNDDERQNLRSILVKVQHRLANWLALNWESMQVD
jgi:hypothetical protein